MPGIKPGMTECGIASQNGLFQNPSMPRTFYVYLLASRRNGTLYAGVTASLRRRMFEHKTGLKEGFTQRYGVKMLVWYEEHPTALSAIQREKNIKHWPREWKLNLIEESNPNWEDLAPEGGVF
jgi:putative endonuclease